MKKQQSTNSRDSNKLDETQQATKIRRLGPRNRIVDDLKSNADRSGSQLNDDLDSDDLINSDSMTILIKGQFQSKSVRFEYN